MFDVIRQVSLGIDNSFHVVVTVLDFLTIDVLLLEELSENTNNYYD
jgi:hypothetical protein